MVNALGAYVQSVFANPMNSMNSGMNSSSSGAPGSIPTPSSMNGPSSMSGDPSTVGFYFRGSLVPLIHVYQPSTPKPQL